jgi:hypothetical protein
MSKVQIIDSAMVPGFEWQEPDGAKRHCLDFSYNPNVTDPWSDFPKAIIYKNMTFVMAGHNSDTCLVHYKEGEPAIPLIG